MIIFNESKKVLLGERYGNPGVFQFPQGGVEDEFSIEENVYKEIEEELGIKRELVEIVKRLKSTNRYDFKSPPSYAIGRWRGQEQSFWLVKFLGTDKDINLDTPHPEFMSFIWCNIEEVYKKAEQKRIAGYNGAVQEVKLYFTKEAME